MTFLNKKEQVMVLNLTQYGKEALRAGRFHPTFYKFFDDGIIYDSKYCGQDELSSFVQDRILTNTSKLSPPKVIYGVETRQNSGLEYLDRKRRYFQPNKIDEEILLRNEILDGDSNKQNITHTNVSIKSEFATYDTSTGITKTTGSYVMTKNYNIKLNNEYILNRATVRQWGGWNNWVDVTNTTSLGEGIKLLFDEDHDFLDNELYDYELFLVEDFDQDQVPGTSMREVLVPLVEAAGPADSYLVRNKYFNIYTDESVPDVWENIQDYKPDVDSNPLNTEEVVEESSITDIDNIYADTDFEDSIENCEEGE